MYNKDNFFAILENAKVTNKALSTAIGVSSGNISDWKSGKSKPNVDAITKIADYLDCSVDYLLGRTDN
ncbi:MAG: helix-turn-helix transcriptional regulator, partial [bacterium]|nr:helix-turn-helix transcriptional regulator [bacterium]